MTKQLVELGEIQQREHATDAWLHYWYYPTPGRIAVAAGGGGIGGGAGGGAGGGIGGGAVSCSKVSCGTQNGWCSNSHIGIRAKAAAQWERRNTLRNNRDATAHPRVQSSGHNEVPKTQAASDRVTSRYRPSCRTSCGDWRSFIISTCGWLLGSWLPSSGVASFVGSERFVGEQSRYF